MQISKTFQKAAIFLVALMAATSIAASAQGAAKILKPADMGKLVPQSVFYRGQTATTQIRNSSGIKFADGYYVLASLVDTSGYSTGIAAKYQAYFITEVPIKIDGKSLPTGAYGIGFIDGHKFVVTNLGAHDVLTATSVTDSEIKHPMPLQILPGAGGGFRLYIGRSYVVLTR